MAEQPARTPARVVLVDDASEAAGAVGRALANGAAAIETRSAASLAEALAGIEGFDADVILVGSEQLGSQAGAAPRARSAANGAVAALLLAYAPAFTPELGRALPDGVDVLLAPFLPELVRARIHALAERRRLQYQLLERAVDEELLKLERDVQIGRTIQLGFLPSSLPEPKGWQVHACFRPAREVAGDFYDAFELVNGRRLGFLIADVCDKGVGAALFMALFRSLIRSGAQQHTSLSWMDPRSGSVTEDKDWLAGDPSQRRQSLPTIGTGSLMNAIAGTNDYILANHMEQGYFATVFFAVLDPSNGTLLYINGGHNPPVVLRTDGSSESLKTTGPAVGMIPGAKFRIGQTRLRPGDVLFAYTDGVPDARSSDGEFYGLERMLESVRRGTASARELIEGVEAHVTRHIADAPQFDDITMLAVRRQLTSEADEASTPSIAT